MLHRGKLEPQQLKVVEDLGPEGRGFETRLHPRSTSLNPVGNPPTGLILNVPTCSNPAYSQGYAGKHSGIVNHPIPLENIPLLSTKFENCPRSVKTNR
ncbi:hypothetical protein AVEN_172443-1 [Araneus ventricosus]|uniref:Uncharacterized protein n=1 Tax=Araneus ventricosus TaxID=182803 RepID=A0A4Y2VJ20_ARAVE|nr:hypothetical protein AVEN_172443-1 [Araneus ventricosus]